MGAWNFYIIPVVMGSIFIYGMICGVKVFDVFLEGAREGLSVVIRILPALVALMTAIGIFKVSGALDILTLALEPAAQLIQLPKELIPLALLRPLSGSGSMAIFRDVLTTYGPDSYIGRVASVLQGSTETTFYTIAVYFGATGIRKTRHALPAALAADVAGFIMSVLTVNLLFR